MNKHTPGPWGKINDNAGDRFHNRDGHLFMTVIYWNRGADPEERIANDRIIAAAPDLLAALQRFVRCESWLRMMSRNEKERSDWAKDITIARAAIRKARGE